MKDQIVDVILFTKGFLHTYKLELLSNVCHESFEKTKYLGSN